MNLARHQGRDASEGSFIWGTIKRYRYRARKVFFCILLTTIGACRLSLSYSFLTHEQIIDIVWKDDLQPLLLARFPNASADELRQAHAYAYGGSLIQDMGYYPFGNKSFTDLTHYVRSGDFVANLLQQSSNLKEYAFALGALAH